MKKEAQMFTTAKIPSHWLIKLQSLLITLILTSIILLSLLGKVGAEKITETEAQAGRACNAIGSSVAFVLKKYGLPSSGIRARGYSTPDGLYHCVVSRQNTVIMRIGLDRHGSWSNPY